MNQDRIGDGGGAEFERVMGELLNRMANGTYALKARLPAQRELAAQFGVSRDTVQRVLRQLANEGWIETRQGSGSRVISRVIKPQPPISSPTGPGVTLNRLMDAAFEKPEVTLDVFTLTSESLSKQVQRQKERILRAECPAPQRIDLRMLLPDEDLTDWLYPVAVVDAETTAVRRRLLKTTHRHTDTIKDELFGLRADGRVPSVDIKIRHVRVTPQFKLYLVNGSEMLLAPYLPVERRVVLIDEDNKEVDAIDSDGSGATYTHEVKDDDPRSQASVTVDSWQDWFNETWKLLAT
ncbi:GntR family transcriptional regulator [Streptomyces curacoi]|uniref:HTH gntR-type domain-containing protein n=1 Tax=Streptomyces curacoi TaxID=146536 RepID=A0A117P3A2_9ACTN|nr:GntR family transcriptional regulator [Streptomyces curacoi]KUM72253.1 hypothetical protein AQI70_23390 [Streptomyces curacoi]